MKKPHIRLGYTRLRKRVRIILVASIVALILSGLTALPLQWEIDALNDAIGEGTFMESVFPPMARWISRVHEGLTVISHRYPFIYYGTDWLVFAHIVIAISFIGPVRDPVRNIWVVEYAMIACVGVLPVAFILGPVREIPLFWRLIDCMFGIFGFVPLAISRRYIKQMERLARCSDQAEVCL